MIVLLSLILFLPNLNLTAALSYGDGTDNCNWASSQTLAPRVFNCDSVNIGGAATISFSDSDYIIIRSQGDVVIDGDINLNATGSTAGSGGGDGGVCAVANSCNGIAADAKFGAHGRGGGMATNGGGGGGSGGRFGSTLPTAGVQGDDTNLGGPAGAGASVPPSTYYPENNFENEFSGGTGGGAGGSGYDSANYEIGGYGGGGGGGIIIIAKGSVTISGNIYVNGADGNDGSDAAGGQGGGGGGGGGSGGAVYIIGRDGVTITGSISAIGGNQVASNGGSGNSVLDPGGNGGKGGDGKIRIDTPSGSYTGGATTPVAYQSTLPSITDPVNSSGGAADYESAISPSCVYKEHSNFGLSFIFSLLTLLLILKIPKVFRRHQY